MLRVPICTAPAASSFPSALAVAGAKAYVERHRLKGKSLVAVASGANLNFDRLRFVAAGYESYEVGVDGMREQRTLVLGMKKIEPLESGTSPRKPRAAVAGRGVPRAGGAAAPGRPAISSQVPGRPNADIPFAPAPLKQPAAKPTKSANDLLMDL